MAKRLAFLTIGVLQEPVGHPKVQGFIDRVPSVYDAADASDGFIARSQRDLVTWEQSWGPIVIPKCFGGGTDFELMPTTLSLWEDLESVAAFAYHGAHGEAMPIRKEWFTTHDLPESVAWWVEEGHDPKWQEGADRVDYLHEHGPTAHAFTIKRPFTADGEPTTLQTERVKAKIAANAAKR